MTAGNPTMLGRYDPLDHERVLEELPSYLLDDIDPGLSREIAAHLDDCACCTEEEARLDTVLGALGTLVPQAPPPPSLRLRVLERLDEPASPASPAAGVATGIRNGRYPKLLALHRGRARRLGLGAGLAALIAFAIIGAMLVRDLQQSQARLAQDRARAALIQSVMAAPAATVPLIEDGADYSYGALYLAPDGHQAVMAVSWLPPTASNQIYQVWLVDNGQRTSAGLFRVGAGGSAQFLINTPRPLNAYQSLGVTVEPAPDGSPGPTGPRVVSCKLPQN